MRLTALLFGKQPPLRRLFSGKHRFARKVTLAQKSQLLQDLARDEANVFYLMHPYVTAEQEKIWMVKEAELNAQAYEQMVHERFKENMYKSVTFEERLEHLKIGESWE